MKNKRLASAKQLAIIMNWIEQVNLPAIKEAIEAIQEHGHYSETLQSIVDEYQEAFDMNQVYCDMDSDTLMDITEEIYNNLDDVLEYLPTSLYNELTNEDK